MHNLFEKAKIRQCSSEWCTHSRVVVELRKWMEEKKLLIIAYQKRSRIFACRVTSWDMWFPLLALWRIDLYVNVPCNGLLCIQCRSTGVIPVKEYGVFRKFVCDIYKVRDLKIYWKLSQNWKKKFSSKFFDFFALFGPKSVEKKLLIFILHIKCVLEK